MAKLGTWAVRQDLAQEITKSISEPNKRPLTRRDKETLAFAVCKRTQVRSRRQIEVAWQGKTGNEITGKRKPETVGCWCCYITVPYGPSQPVTQSHLTA